MADHGKHKKGKKRTFKEEQAAFEAAKKRYAEKQAKGKAAGKSKATIAYESRRALEKKNPRTPKPKGKPEVLSPYRRLLNALTPKPKKKK